MGVTMANLPALDHLVIDVGAKLDDAAAAYQRLGFQLTERGHHTLGSANHLAMFETNYLELLSPGPAGAPVREELAGFAEGLNGLVLATESADATYSDLTARGVDLRAPQSFSRPVTLQDGTTRDAKFRTTHLARHEVPFGRLYFCQHDTRDLVWRPEWQRHPNGAREVVGVVISAANPPDVAGLFTRMFGVTAVEGKAGLQLTAGPVTIEIAGHDAVARDLGEAAPQPNGRDVFIAVMRVQTASLAQAAQAIGAAQTAPYHDGHVLVRASAAGNVALDFVEQA